MNREWFVFMVAFVAGGIMLRDFWQTAGVACIAFAVFIALEGDA